MEKRMAFIAKQFTSVNLQVEIEDITEDTKYPRVLIVCYLTDVNADGNGKQIGCEQQAKIYLNDASILNSTVIRQMLYAIKGHPVDFNVDYVCNDILQSLTVIRESKHNG
jgi:hypothetical protein